MCPATLCGIKGKNNMSVLYYILHVHSQSHEQLLFCFPYILHLCTTVIIIECPFSDHSFHRIYGLSRKYKCRCHFSHMLGSLKFLCSLSNLLRSSPFPASAMYNCINCRKAAANYQNFLFIHAAEHAGF